MSAADLHSLQTDKVDDDDFILKVLLNSFGEKVLFLAFGLAAKLLTQVYQNLKRNFNRSVS